MSSLSEWLESKLADTFYRDPELDAAYANNTERFQLALDRGIANGTVDQAQAGRVQDLINDSSPAAVQKEFDKGGSNWGLAFSHWYLFAIIAGALFLYFGGLTLLMKRRS